MKKTTGVIMLAVALAGSLAFVVEEKNKNEIKTDVKMEAKIDSLIKLMTLEEKVTMVHASSSFTSGGVPRLGIPEIVMSDGPHGVRKEHGRDWTPDNAGNDSSSYLPTGMTLAATWNTELSYASGTVLGQEANARGKDIILGPGVNILRTPLNGRNFEYMSEDPYLAARMVVPFIKGVQDQGISACVKHYLANNQEILREKINVQMSERALREIYLPAFAAAVQEGQVNSLMGAYNKFRGQFCTHNEYLINTILKGELGFKGVVMSDWGAVHNTLEAAQNGCDLEMGSEFNLSSADKPNYNNFYMADPLIKAVKDGTVKESLVDEKVRRLLRLMLKTNVLTKNKRKKGSINTPEHHAAVLKVAEESITLLKNENILPLNKASVKTIAVIGANGDRKFAGAGGSSQVPALYEITPLKGIKNLLGAAATVKYSKGYKIGRNKVSDPEMIQEALETAKGADVVVYVGGWIHGYSDDWNDNAFDAENADKPNMQLPFGQYELIDALLKDHPNMVVVLMGGGPCDMTTFAPKTKAIIQAWYPGMEGGNALAKILFGEINPSGKLPMTFPSKLEDSPAHKLGEYPGNGVTVNYNEGIFVGYRYFDTKKVAPLFPFGHGLSYTTFEFSNLKLEKNGQTVTAKLSVKNTGKVAGKEVVQIYVKSTKSAVERPEKELKGFNKVNLKAGESKELTFTLPAEAFKYYDETKKQWVLETGKYSIVAGSSSRDIKVSSDIDL
jgi:beta-glucosidase